MATYNGTNGNDTFAYGGSDDDVLYGGAGNDNLDGGNGEDSVYGGTGNDTLEGGSGNDVIDGDSDDDLLFGGSGEDSISGALGNDQIYGGADNDSVYGWLGNDTLYGGLGDDLVSGDQEDDTVFGEGGNDQLFGFTGNDFVYGGTGNDTVVGDDGNDTLFGDEGSDELFAGIGNDQLFGGADNDDLYAGSGNDFLSGGAGDDTLTLGSGNDQVEFSRYGGDDVITDFDTSDNDVDGFYNDQLDVSDLRTLSGDPITTADVTPVDIGGGNVRLDFPEGESITLQGVSFSQMSTPAQLYAAGIPCFTAGTLIATPKGQVSVELLRPGDRVLTRDNGIKELAWVGTRTLNRSDLVKYPNLRPIRVERGVFGNDVPLLFSPQHGILRPDANTRSEHLIRANHLARLKGGGVRVARGARDVTYVHLLFDQHEVVLSGGLWSESYYPGPQAIKMMSEPELIELKALFPDLFVIGPEGTFGPTAREIPKFRGLSGHETDLIVDTKQIDG